MEAINAMLQQAPYPQSAGEHEAYTLMYLGIDAAQCEIVDPPRLVENCQNIPRSWTFMVEGVSPTIPRQNVRLRCYVLPDGTLELVAIAHDQAIAVMKRRGEPSETFFIDHDLWQSTAVVLFGPRSQGRAESKGRR